jgi:hypothetical protein
MRLHRILSVLNIVFIPWSIVTIEITLNWNHLNGVLLTNGPALHATGQLIPALIGGAGLLRILWILSIIFFKVRILGCLFLHLCLPN